MTKLTKVASRTPMKRKATPAKMAKNGKAANNENEDESALLPNTPVQAEEPNDNQECEHGNNEAALTPGKRKAQQREEAPPPKKTKPESEGFRLFVGNLNKSKSFDEIRGALADFFSGNDFDIKGVRIESSRKFAYVDFATEEDLQKALVLNGQEVLGQGLRLDKAKVKESPEERKKRKDACTLFVKNIPSSATMDTLKEVFNQAVKIRIPPGDKSQPNKGIAYVEFKSEQEAAQALEEKQGADVQGRSVFIDFLGDKSQKASKTAATASSSLMVSNLAYSVSEKALQGVFKKAISVRIPLKNDKPKGYAFVEFGTVEDATEALESLNSTEVEGRPIRLEYSRSTTPKTGGSGAPAQASLKTLYVKGLSQNTTEETLRDAFEGAVAARVARHKDTGSSKGFGFVDFDSEESCGKAKQSMEDCEIDGCQVKLDFARTRKEGGGGGGAAGPQDPRETENKVKENRRGRR
ncbi:hypothetical protein AGOR_G00236760 [Albula goreensis]|uniref:RRM domain-containing protein n=1 Tax=Albula goreensis TaxID=1534307 RepID=A0A8T3CFH9_9TELE|nr:hypothetical protein AGOR_G00236760 [Albula goreensis]